MNHLIELLSYPFVQRALLAGVFSGALLAILGIFVVLRKMAFFSDGIAHTALAGVAIALLVGQEPLLWAVFWGIIFSVSIFFLEKKTDISPDSLIGILFTSSLALGVVLINFKKGYQPDLLSFLFGNILTIRSAELWAIIPVSFAIGAFTIYHYKKYLFICLNQELAYLAGIRTEAYRLILYVLLAISSILAIKMFGIILVSALIIIPVSFGKLFARSAKSLLVISIVFVEMIIIAGTILSLLFNLPTGAVIVLVGTVFFVLGMMLSRLLAKSA
jgi:ABC-type Mn2+/Zn2+ transport system permease subunit